MKTTILGAAFAIAGAVAAPSTHPKHVKGPLPLTTALLGDNFKHMGFVVDGSRVTLGEKDAAAKFSLVQFGAPTNSSSKRDAGQFMHENTHKCLTIHKIDEREENHGYEIANGVLTLEKCATKGTDLERQWFEVRDGSVSFTGGKKDFSIEHVTVIPERNYTVALRHGFELGNPRLLNFE